MSLRFAGYAALFDKPDGARDTIQPGAFARTIADRSGPLPIYWQHNPDKAIGVIDRIEEDGRGLRVIGKIDNPDGLAATRLKRREVTGLSFGYRAHAFRHEPGGRILKEIELFEVSLVTHPLQHEARVHMIA